jgi:DNA-binding NtrC family response regulator
VRDRLGQYDWRRNNVRELRNLVEQLVIAGGEDQIIGLEALPAGFGQTTGRAAAPAEATPSGGGTLKDQKAAAERAIILAALERHSWRITETAHDLGLADHSSLLKIMRRHGLKR